jgi:hypothetical protein
MPGDVQAGGFFWRMGVKSTVREDLAGSKQAINEFEGTTNKAGKTVDTFDNTIKKTSGSTRGMMRPVMDLGMGLTALGGAAYTAGITMGESGKGMQQMGSAVIGVGGAVMAAGPLIKGFSSVVSGEANKSMTEFITLAKDVNPETIAMGVGLVALATTVAILADSNRTTTITIRDQMQAWKDAAEAVTKYDDSITTLKDKLAGLPSKEKLQNQLTGMNLQIASAASEIVNPKTYKTPLEKAMALNQLAGMKISRDEIQKQIDELPNKQKEIKALLPSISKNTNVGGYTTYGELAGTQTPEGPMAGLINLARGTPTDTGDINIGPIYVQPGQSVKEAIQQAVEGGQWMRIESKRAV